MNLLRTLLRLGGAYKLYERMLEGEVKDGEIPSHIAFILDGNRRWARLRNVPSWMGHEEGAKKADEVLDWCLELGVKTVTLFILSTENISRRSRHELLKLYEIIERHLRSKLDDKRIHENKVRVKALGRLNLLPSTIRKLLMELEDMTRTYDERYLNIAIAYGGRDEIIEAARKLARDVVHGKVMPEEINEELFSKYLYTSHLPNPYPDMIIRTSGELRISNFLLWQSAYSEIVVIDVYWPEFRKIDLLRAIRTYQKRNRRFGR